MADYYAVLNRTLSGFGEPKPGLRAKLYDRARVTIRRQIEARNSAPDVVESELARLEEAIERIEKNYVGAETASDPVPEAQESSGATDGLPGEKPAISFGRSAQTDPEPEASPADVPIFDQGRSAFGGPAPEGDGPAPVDRPVFDPAQSPVATDGGQAAEYPSRVTNDPASSLDASDASSDPISDWAREFLGGDPATAHEKADDVIGSEPGAFPEALARDNTVQTEAPRDADFAGGAIPQGDIYDPAPAVGDAAGDYRDPIDIYANDKDEPLTIPPAEGLDRYDEPRSGGWLKWLLIAILVALIGLAIAAFVLPEQRDQVLRSIGAEGLFEDSVTPTPVRTITIRPDPVEPETEQPVVPAPEVEQPKNEDRLTGDDNEVILPEPIPVTPTQIAPGATPSGDDAATPPATPVPDTGAAEPATDPAPATPAPDSDAAAPAAPAATPAPAAPPVAQSAILYEEATGAGQSQFDSGRVVWSKVDEPTGPNGEMQPAIRARAEIPSRQLVLIMTIKKNNDKALPASHLIELVFAVPDNFSGGAISEINRFVLKENEQGRGDPLVGVPARIADGIFLIALNNLEAARAKNSQLLKGRNWVDIPVQYRTGRRALITMEKGVPGTAIFNDVFAAWEKG